MAPLPGHLSPPGYRQLPSALMCSSHTLLNAVQNPYYYLSLLSCPSGLPVSTVGAKPDLPFGVPEPAQV